MNAPSTYRPAFHFHYWTWVLLFYIVAVYTHYTPTFTYDGMTKSGWPLQITSYWHTPLDKNSLWLNRCAALLMLVTSAFISECFWRWKSRQPRLGFKLHLSTIVLLTILAGLLLGLNFVRRPAAYVEGPFAGYKEIHQGFPLPFHAWAIGDSTQRDIFHAELFDMNLDPGNIIFNVYAGIAILLLVGYLCEWRIHKSRAP